MITSEEIKKRLWDGANELRGSMDASRYKDYMLGLMFYKFLSDKTLEIFSQTAGLSRNDDLLEEYIIAHQEYGSELDKMIQDVLGYFVLPEYLYQSWIKDMNNGEFEVQKVTDSLNAFERTISSGKDSDDFKGLFSSSTLDLSDTALGSNLNERSKNIRALIRLFEDLDMVSLQQDDVLGDAYEYLIGQFAMESGKKAGEFYTPRQVSEVMARILAKTSNIQSIYDPTVGSGSLLLTVKKHLKEEEQKDLSYYGQEKNTSTYNLTRMNLLLHGVRPEKMSIKNGDTLAQDWPEDPKHPSEGVQFDAVVMNPPYSVKNWNSHGLKVSDPRFEVVGVLPPDSKGDLAFLLHGLYHLGQEGAMAIVLPHGVLFRGGTEGEIRKRLIEKNQIDTVIGLPGNLFTNTGIPVCVIILKKNRSLNEPIQIIDASKDFIKVGKQNVLQEKDIAKIVDVYETKQAVTGYSHLATRQELIENDYNLNIPRYVEEINQTFPEDVDAHLFGGIPEDNIKQLHSLNSICGDIIEQSFSKIRPGYVELKGSVEELTTKVLEAPKFKQLMASIQQDLNEYIDNFWTELHDINKETDLNNLKDRMLVAIKQLLSQYPTMDVYNGYQLISEIWDDELWSDAEAIKQFGFYTCGRSREKNMVMKKKIQVQDGWTGTLIPIDLIKSTLYKEEMNLISIKQDRISEIDNLLSDLIELAKTEDTVENDVLFDSIKRNKEDELQDSFESKKIKAELKAVSKNSEAYVLLTQIDTLMSEKTTLAREIRNELNELQEETYERILTLTDPEIDQLLYEKWFGQLVSNMTKLVEKPVRHDLSVIKMLDDRYSMTLDEIDLEIAEKEIEFSSLLSELVVM